MGLEDTCVNAARKPRPTGVKRGPYRKDEKAQGISCILTCSVNSAWDLNPTPSTSPIPALTVESSSSSPTSSQKELELRVPCGLDVLSSLICNGI